MSIGLFLMEPATIITTAETGETARSRLPARPIGMDTASTLIPAAAASGTMSGTIAKNSAVPEPESSAMSAVRPTRISGSTKPIPEPDRPVIAFCSSVIRPMDLRPTTNTEAATNSATIGIAPPMPLKKDSVPARVSLPLRVRMSSQIMAITKERMEASSTLRSIFAPVVEVMTNTMRSMTIGSSGKIAYTVR